jgi:soluble lytic murein transglycosylase-like protein
MADRHGTQTSLLDVLDGNQYAQEYRRWRDEHPEVFRLFLAAATAALNRGERFSISKLTEEIRWEEALPETPSFKINNNFRAYLARDLLAAMPELRGFLKIRAVAGGESNLEMEG